ncbi:MAG: hypothetical protein ACI856_002988, partial [Kiritimatiellia bacterium]
SLIYSLTSTTTAYFTPSQGIIGECRPRRALTGARKYRLFRAPLCWMPEQMHLNCSCCILLVVPPVLPEPAKANWQSFVAARCRRGLPRAVLALVRGHFPTRRKLLVREKALLQNRSPRNMRSDAFVLCWLHLAIEPTFALRYRVRGHFPTRRKLLVREKALLQNRSPRNMRSDAFVLGRNSSLRGL